MFDWSISILNFSQVLIFFLIGSFRSYISVNCCFSFSLPVSCSLQRSENAVCTCLSGFRKINALKSKKLRPLEVLGVEDNFVVNMVSV